MGDASAESIGLNGTTVTEAPCALRNSTLDAELKELFSENVAAKIWRVAVELVEDDKQPDKFPEYVPATGDKPGKYTSRESKFWTCGFFPGCLYTILERSKRFPKSLPLPSSINRFTFHDQLLQLCRTWSGPLHNMAFRRDTHDLGFIIMPALRQEWEMNDNRQALDSILTAAESLASRYDERVGAIRSWDKSFSKRYSITDKEENFLVIADSMCNLDLLYYAGYHTNNQHWIDVATKHAHAVRKTIIREDWSSYHVISFDLKTGGVMKRYTHQGYKDDSTWARGQAWMILGFAQTYLWTKDPSFLDTVVNLSNYFLSQLSSSTLPYPYVPKWDFDDNNPDVPRDTSAGMIAANGMVLLHQILSSQGSQSPYISAVRNIVRDTIDLALSEDRVAFTNGSDRKRMIGTLELEDGKCWDSILTDATANNNEYAIHRYSRHGLVYADYYFLELGNKMLRMGLV